MNEEMKKGTVIALQGVKEEMATIVAELNRKGFEKPKGFSVLEGYIADNFRQFTNLAEVEDVNIFTISVQGELHCFIDDLDKEQIAKCNKLADEYRKDSKKHTLSEYRKDLLYRYGIILHKAPISFCVGF